MQWYLSLLQITDTPSEQILSLYLTHSYFHKSDKSRDGVEFPDRERARERGTEIKTSKRSVTTKRLFHSLSFACCLFSLPLLCDFFACPKKVIMRGLYFLCVVAKFQSVQELWATHGATESDERLTLEFGFSALLFSCKKKCSASPTFCNKTYTPPKKGNETKLFSVFEESRLCECLATDVHTVKNLLVQRGATTRRKQVYA